MARAAAAPAEFTFGYVDKGSGARVGPQPKQVLAHTSLADLLFYGGAAFGGKTEYQVVDALSVALAYQGSSQAIFRRTHKQLKQHVVGRLAALCPPWLGRLNSSDMVFKLSNGSEIWLCHAQHESSVYNYQTAEWLVLRCDEASHFTEFQVRYLITRVRTSTPGWWPRVRLTSNPGNVGHGWLKRWFVRPLAHELGDRGTPAPGEVWRPLPTDDDPHPMTRQFVPAYAADNHAGMLADPHYMSRIRQLGGDKARQLEHGDWDANESMIVGGTWRESYAVTDRDTALLGLGFAAGQVIPWHIVPVPWRPSSADKVYGSVDYGYGAPWSFHLHAALPGGHTRTWHERYKARVRDVDQADQIRRDLEHFGSMGVPKPEWIVCDPAMWNSRAEMGLAKSIAEVYQDALAPIGVRIMRGAAGRPARLSRPNRWLDALAVADDGLPRHTFTTACKDAIRTVPEVPWDEEDPEVEDDDAENHAYEDIGRFFEARPHAPRAQVADELAKLDPLSRAHHEARERRTTTRHAGALGNLHGR